MDLAKVIRPYPSPPDGRRLHAQRMGQRLRAMLQVCPQTHIRVSTNPSRNLKPGGWIEQLEVDPHIICTDGTLPANSSTVQFAEAIINAAKQANQPIDTVDTMRGRMSKLGFIDIHEKKYNWPMGPWPRDPLLKEAGRLHYHQWMHGMEGWAMYYLTKWGTPSPWSPDEVQVLVAKARKELKDGRAHMWQYAKRVWARKPTEEEMFEIQSPRGQPIKNEFDV